MTDHVEAYQRLCVVFAGWKSSNRTGDPAPEFVKSVYTAMGFTAAQFDADKDTVVKHLADKVAEMVGLSGAALADWQQKFATGGFVKPGKNYRVGDVGPERFTPGKGVIRDEIE